MPVLKYAAQLCKVLAASGTGEGKLDLIRELIVRNPLATAEEAYEQLQRSPHRCTRDTLMKARRAIETGTVGASATPEAVPTIEDQATAFIESQKNAAAKQQIRATGPKFDASGVWAPKLATAPAPDAPSLPSLGIQPQGNSEPSTGSEPSTPSTAATSSGTGSPPPSSGEKK